MKELKMYINGKFCESRSGKWIDVLNPSTEEVISRQPDGTIEDVNEALDAARAAQKAWAARTAIDRAGWLNKIAAGIRKEREKFIDIIMREQGKTLTWATVEVDVTADYFDYMATFARHIEGEIIPSDRPGEIIMLTKKPIGVVAGILPWNFPFFLIARKAGAALIAGCTIVIKPSQITPENCTEFAKILDDIQLPAGVINIVTGRGWQAVQKSTLSALLVAWGLAKASCRPQQRISPRYHWSWEERLLPSYSQMQTSRLQHSGCSTAVLATTDRFATMLSVFMFTKASKRSLQNCCSRNLSK